MIRALVVLAAASLLLAGCGGAKTAAPATTTTSHSPGPATLLGAGATALYAGGDWAVVVSGGRVAVAHKVAGRWSLQKGTNVSLRILGPQPGRAVHPVSQVAFEVKGATPIVETGLWVDSRELVAKGGGSPTEGTIYGATPKLSPGVHRAVGYGRTSQAGAAITWTFRVR